MKKRKNHNHHNLSVNAMKIQAQVTPDVGAVKI
jgi:hypothetical protein